MGKGEIIGTRFQLKLVSTEHRGLFQAHYFIVGVLVGMWQGQQGRNWGRIQTISTLFRETRDNKMSGCITSELNECRRLQNFSRGKKSIFIFLK